MNRRGRGYQDFPSKTFFLTVPKFSVGWGGGVLDCFINFGYGKSLDKGGGGSIKIFHRKKFAS